MGVGVCPGAGTHLSTVAPSPSGLRMAQGGVAGEVSFYLPQKLRATNPKASYKT